MKPFVIIKDFSVFEDHSASSCFGIETTVFTKALSLEIREEAFVHCVIVAVAFRAHALSKSIESNDLSKLLAGILAATF